MGFVQQNSGAWTGTTFTATLSVASSASNRVVVIVSGNTTVTTPAGFTLRTSQVNIMGHYAFDSAGGSASYVFTTAAGQGTWWISELPAGAHVISTSSNAATSGTTQATPNLTPTAGTRMILASIGGSTNTAVRTITAFTNSFVEQIDLGQPTADNPMQGGALLDAVTANGSTAYSTTGTYSASVDARSGIITAYSYTAGAVTLPPIIVLAPRR